MTTIHPDDLVRLGGDTEYTVEAVSRAGKDVYVREPASRMAGGTWVTVESVTHINGEAVR